LTKDVINECTYYILHRPPPLSAFSLSAELPSENVKWKIPEINN
jgi:hypothetical protein